jgi:hypothetical protein
MREKIQYQQVEITLAAFENEWIAGFENPIDGSIVFDAGENKEELLRCVKAYIDCSIAIRKLPGVIGILSNQRAKEKLIISVLPDVSNS